MIVRNIMTTKLITIAADDTLAHAANLLRQHRFHHLPVIQTIPLPADAQADAQLPPQAYASQGKRPRVRAFEGIITAEDINMAAAVDQQQNASAVQEHPWTERRVYEVMHQALMQVTQITSVASAAQILVERNLNYLPVVEYLQLKQENKPILVGLVTRSDLLLALARAMGAFEPGMQIDISLPMGDMTPLAHALQIASELHTSIRSIIAAPLTEAVPSMASLRVGTINPMPFLARLQAEGIHYVFGASLSDGTSEIKGV
ncbi:MAG TPA: CBS domain-containing protein [Ktedonobacteraceae bacterium]|jgi:acetoin utilization protein AcuB|nr:CBS domain-containing protein [Ktedonobacteraceae bacterium]